MIQVNIVNQEELVFSGQAKIVFAPAMMGEVGILPGHSPFLSTLKQGEVRIRDAEDKEQLIFVSGGFIEVQPDIVTILSDAALHSDEVDQAALLHAKQIAESMMEKAKTDLDIAKAETALANATAKIELLTHLRDKLKKRGL